ncbi:unnamed protein product [Aspergillus oryzae]|nr:unnamed protein product [Aspergillus oryzae]GMF91037.1 unnamed protein product [Aspergillus oryzae]GMG15590.1 unnamed protein product [Aspergillus oryzae]
MANNAPQRTPSHATGHFLAKRLDDDMVKVRSIGIWGHSARPPRSASGTNSSVYSRPWIIPSERLTEILTRKGEENAYNKWEKGQGRRERLHGRAIKMAELSLSFSLKCIIATHVARHITCPYDLYDRSGQVYPDVDITV